MLYITSDHAGFELKERIIEICWQNDMEVMDILPEYDKNDDYPDSAKALADRIRENDGALGIAVCGTSQGICMAMNRFSWIRAGIVHNPQITKQIRLHNHANVICIPGPYSGEEFTDQELFDIIRSFLETDPDMDERHARRVEKLSSIR